MAAGQIAITGRHGAHAREKDRPQAFDVALRLALDCGPLSDDELHYPDRIRCRARTSAQSGED